MLPPLGYCWGKGWWWCAVGDTRVARNGMMFVRTCYWGHVPLITQVP